MMAAPHDRAQIRIKVYVILMFRIAPLKLQPFNIYFNSVTLKAIINYIVSSFEFLLVIIFALIHYRVRIEVLFLIHYEQGLLTTL